MTTEQMCDHLLWALDEAYGKLRKAAIAKEISQRATQEFSAASSAIESRAAELRQGIVSVLLAEKAAEAANTPF